MHWTGYQRSQKGRGRICADAWKWLELLACVPSNLIGLSPDLRIIKWNSSAERIFGIAGDRMLGVIPINNYPINWDRQKLSEAISLCRADNAVTRLDSFRFVHPDGRRG